MLAARLTVDTCSGPFDVRPATASDAFFVLKAAIRGTECPSTCDQNCDGKVTVWDAFYWLKAPACLTEFCMNCCVPVTTTTPTTTSTTVAD